LAWIAVCEEGADEVTVFVGSGVEVTDDWLCEGIWDGPYIAGDLDRTDVVFGSGVRLRGDTVVFVSSGTTVDRLHAWEGEGEQYVSNSLPCILAFAGGRLDLFFEQYGRVSRSIVKGLDAYERSLPTTVGPVQLTYFNNLVWDGHELSEVPKPDLERDFSTYETYRSFLDETMERLSTNARAPQRRSPFGLVSTLSSGYDSPTSSVLASQVGCHRAFGFDLARRNRHDSGAPIARILGLQYDTVETKAWRSEPMAAVPFLAALTSNGSSVPFKGAEALLAGNVVFTGFHGDKVWDRKTQDLGPNIVRSDGSGTDLTEYRLWVGFVNCAVPFLGVRQIKDIHGITISADLAPWDIKGGYSRPICRRIVEERSVPRHEFGVEKKATAQFILRADNFLTREMRLDYYRWLRSRRLAWVSRGVKPPSRLTDARFVARARVGMMTERLRGSGAVNRLGRRVDGMLTRLLPESDPRKRHVFHQYAFHWAVERAKERYPEPRWVAGAPGSSSAASQPVRIGRDVPLLNLARKSLRKVSQPLIRRPW
jgi:hypothetical protein